MTKPTPNRADRFISRPGDFTIERAPAKPSLVGELAEPTLPILGQLRREAGLTQAELAERMGIDQAGVSRLERRRDLKLSTVRDYLAALGAGNVELTATLADDRQVSLPLARR